MQINSKEKEKVIRVSFIITNVTKFAGLKFVPKAIPLFNTTKQWQFSPLLPKSGQYSLRHLIGSFLFLLFINQLQCSILLLNLESPLTKKQSEFHPILSNGNELEVLRSAKLQGATIITSDLSWGEHVNETVKKASKRLYFLVQLKRARLPCSDLVLTCIRSILVYVAPVFFYALPMAKYLRCELSMERVQKGHCHSFVPVCLMTRYLRQLVFQPLFHIARTYVTWFLTFRQQV